MILYIGHFFSEEIVKQRGIPFRNSAGSNRIIRIANSFYENERDVEILSPGISLWSKPDSKLSCSGRLEKNENLNTYYAKTVRTPFINIVISTLSILKRISFYSKKSNLSTVIIYNFSPEFLLITLYVKVFTRAIIINNVEDISVPKFADWKSGTESRTFQQIVFFFCMKLIARLADGFIIPTIRFTKYLPIKNKEVVIITGCSKVELADSFGCKYPLRILFSGKLEFEHGIDIFLQALGRLDKSVSEKLVVNICGEGHKSTWVKEEIIRKELNFVTYHGFLSDNKYKYLLSESDVCLVLQNPEGRYKNLKTPSKLFEYYSSGKYVLTSNVGDYDNLPVGSFSILDTYTADNLVYLIKFCVYNLEKIEIGKKAAYNFAKENFEYKKAGQNIINKLKI